MFTADQLQHEIAECTGGRVSVNAFEDWFRVNSRNIHAVEDNALVDAAFSIEGLFSDRQYEDLSDDDFRSQLRDIGQALRPFLFRAESSGTVILRTNLFHGLVPAAATAAVAPCFLSSVVSSSACDFDSSAKTVILLSQSV